MYMVPCVTYWPHLALVHRSVIALRRIKPNRHQLSLSHYLASSLGIDLKSMFFFWKDFSWLRTALSDLKILVTAGSESIEV